MCRKCPIHAIILVAMIWVIAGCAQHAKAPITQQSGAHREPVTVHRGTDHRTTTKPIQRPIVHIVQVGDTLYSIAWRFRLDYRRLSRWNRISNPDVIYVGQRLRLNAASNKPYSADGTAAVAKPKKRVVSGVGKQRTLKRNKKSGPARIRWFWPAAGPVQAASSALGTKGIEILGTRGTPIRAAAGGTVVYSGSGLRGYGQLIIVKHSEEFLSAYAHSERLLVVEGGNVKAGQQIAEMGDSDAKRVMLHFEIRRDGKAVEPLDYLPRR